MENDHVRLKEAVKCPPLVGSGRALSSPDHRILRRALSVLSKVAPVLIAVTQVPQARAQDFTQEELRALPRICHAQKFISSALQSPIVAEAERKQWAERLGEPYESFHHFCWALIYIRRGSDPARSAFQNANYQNAVSNFEYVQRNSTATFALLPEVNLRKGMALRHLGEEGAAATEFLGAIRIKPDYTPAYAALVDIYLDLDDLNAASQVLEQGLKKVPTSKILLNKKAEIENQKQAMRR